MKDKIQDTFCIPVFSACLNFCRTESTQRVSPPFVLQHPRGWEAKRNTALNTPLNPTRRSHLTFKYQKEALIY